MSEGSQQQSPYNLPEGTMVPSSIHRDHGTNQLYSPKDNPEIIARHPYNVDNQYGHEMVANVTDALFHLQENYGINFPGIGNTVPEIVTKEDGGEMRRTFMATSRVEGVNMYSQMGSVPQDVLLTTFDGMMRYYEDLAEDTSDRLYFTEVSLSQCVYGHTESEDTDRVYDVDIDPWLGNITDGANPHGPSFEDGAAKLAGELLAFKRRFPAADTVALEQRMQNIGQRFGAYVPHYS